MFSIKSSDNLVAQLASTKSFACTDFKTKEPKVSPETGEPQWQFSVMIPTEYRFEQFPIKIYAPKDPIEGAKMGDSVELSGVAVDLGFPGSDDGKSRQFWRITADTVLVKKAKA